MRRRLGAQLKKPNLAAGHEPIGYHSSYRTPSLAAIWISRVRLPTPAAWPTSPRMGLKKIRGVARACAKRASLSAGRHRLPPGEVAQPLTRVTGEERVDCWRDARARARTGGSRPGPSLGSDPEGGCRARRENARRQRRICRGSELTSRRAEEAEAAIERAVEAADVARAKAEQAKAALEEALARLDVLL